MAKKKPTKAAKRPLRKKRRKLIGGGEYALPTSTMATTSNLMGLGDPNVFKQNLAQADQNLNSELYRQNQQQKMMEQASEEQAKENLNTNYKTHGAEAIKAFGTGIGAARAVNKVAKGTATAKQVALAAKAGKSASASKNLIGGLSTYGSGATAGTNVGNMFRAAGPGGLGAGLSIAGAGVKAASNDKDATTVNVGETAGTLMQGAGTGLGIAGGLAALGATGFGAPLAALGGIGYGIHALAKRNKARKEKAKQEDLYAAKTDMLSRAQSNAFNKSFTKSGTDYGFNTANSMGGSGAYGDEIMYKTGGYLKPLSGGAVEVVGPSHAKGGVMLDKNTEVEGKETIDKVKMSTGKNSDYVFSQHLKLGGKSFARRHKEILKGGGTQQKIQELAKLQERYARNKNQDPNRDPGNVAKMEDGGDPELEYTAAEGVLDHVPKGQSLGDDSMYGNRQYDFEAVKDRNSWYDWEDFDITNPEDILKFQKAYNQEVQSRGVNQPSIKEDGKWGEQTSTVQLLQGVKSSPAEEIDSETPEGEVKVDSDTTEEFELSEKENAKFVPPAALLGGLSGLAAPAWALNNPAPKSPVIGAEAAPTINLGRLNLNSLRAANTAGNISFQRSAGSGPGGLAARLASNQAARNQDLQIGNEEARQNMGLMNQEASINATIANQNMNRTLAANQSNANLKAERDRFNHEQKLNALKSMGETGAGLTSDYMSYKADNRYANALDDVGAYARFVESERLGAAKYGGYIKRSNKVRRNRKNKR